MTSATENQQITATVISKSYNSTVAAIVVKADVSKVKAATEVMAISAEVS